MVFRGSIFGSGRYITYLNSTTTVLMQAVFHVNIYRTNSMTHTNLSCSVNRLLRGLEYMHSTAIQRSTMQL